MLAKILGLFVLMVVLGKGVSVFLSTLLFALQVPPKGLQTTDSVVESRSEG